MQLHSGSSQYANRVIQSFFFPRFACTFTEWVHSQMPDSRTTVVRLSIFATIYFPLQIPERLFKIAEPVTLLAGPRDVFHCIAILAAWAGSVVETSPGP